MDADLNSQLSLILFDNMHQFRNVAKLLVGGGFGLAVVLQAWGLAKTESSWHRFAQFFFQIGVFSLCALLTLLLIVPGMSTKALVLLGTAFMIVFFLMLWAQEDRFRALVFLGTCLTFVLSVGGSYAVPHNIAANISVVTSSHAALTWVHVSTATFSSALSTVALASSALYLISSKSIKDRKWQGFSKMPSLQSLDLFTEKTLFVGLLFMTISLISGLGMVLPTYTTQSASPAKVVWAFGVWGYYAVVLFGRSQWNWRGKKGALLSVWGALLISVTLFGTLLGTN
jgi:ABC-type uncharacterized transport system permease subunit